MVVVGVVAVVLVELLGLPMILILSVLIIPGRPVATQVAVRDFGLNLSGIRGKVGGSTDRTSGGALGIPGRKLLDIGGNRRDCQ